MQGPDQLAQIPEGSWRDDRILSGEGPVAAMDCITKLPETFTAWKLALPFRRPAFGVVPQGDRLRSVAQIHNAARVQNFRFRQRQAEVAQQPFMAASWFKARHLSGTHVKGPWTAPEGSCATPDLMVGLKQGDLQALSGQQSCCGESGDATADHNHAAFVQGPPESPAMLATEPRCSAMHSGLRNDLVAWDGPLAGQTLRAVEPVGGGCIHQAWSVTLQDGQRLFAKTGGSDAMALFTVEAEGLVALHGHADPELLVVPRPLATVQLAHGAVLLLPWLELGGRDQHALGRGLARLHRASADASPGRFGWHRDGFIGAGPQPGGWRERWGDCFVELRLLPQLHLLGSLIDEWESILVLLEHLKDDLNRHDPAPSLVHGDLWAGNAGSLANQRGCLFDPASWWADREVDLAMTRMFGGFGADFYTSYAAEYPLSDRSEERVEIYNLYHLLNHANLFGGGYIEQSRASLKRLARHMS